MFPEEDENGCNLGVDGVCCSLVIQIELNG
jgi:hypothetical protein